MRDNSFGWKRSFAGRRLLSCEQLEHRALLTALIGSAEFAPGPIAEFTTQAKSFIESALEHVMTTQHQSPTKSSSDRLTGIADDGRPVRITNYTVELDTPVDRGTSQYAAGVVGTTNASAQSALVSAPSIPSRSNLVFSFTIYPDNSVSMRAKLNNPPQWFGFSSISTSSTSLLESLRSPSTANLHAHDLNATTSRTTTEPNDRLVNGDLVAADPTTPNTSIDDAVGQRRTPDDSAQNSSEEDLELSRSPFESLSEQMMVIEFSDGDSVEADQVQARRIASPGQSTSDQANEAVVKLPSPPGMVQLEFSQLVGAHSSAARAKLPASAIYQVFVQASDIDSTYFLNTLSSFAARTASNSESHLLGPLQLSSGLTTADVPVDTVDGIALGLADELSPSRWQTTTLVVASLAGGLVLGIRPKRDQLANPLPRTSSFPA